MVYKLINKDFSFLNSLGAYDREKLIETIREVPLKDSILHNCFDNLKEENPYYAFRIVCDMEDYREFCINYLDSNIKVLNDSNLFSRYFIGRTRWSLEYLSNNFERLLELDTRILFITIRFALDLGNGLFLNSLLFHDNLELRGRVMVELMEMSPYTFMMYYKDLVNCLVRYDKEGNIVGLVDEKYSSRIAYSIVDCNLGMDNYEKIKEFILSNYATNSLAERLDGINVDGEMGIEFTSHENILLKDIDDLFRTSSNYKYRIFAKYPQELSPELKNEFYNSIKEFLMIDAKAVEHMFRVGLGDKFLEFTKKYMEISTGAKVVGNAGIGSCTRSFIVGDYVIKCSYKKWVDVRCPDLFLVARNYEEEIVKNHLGFVIGALEVQKYYHEPFKGKDELLVDKFRESFKELGYEFGDDVLGLNEMPNIFYLDSYLDADCSNPEDLPDWFKKDPIVLVDRDYVKKIKK